MSCETIVTTSNDDQSLSDNVSSKQNKSGWSTTNNSQKLHDLKVVLFKLNVGECFPLPGKSGFSVEYPITAINFGKNRVPGVQKSTERRSKRISEAVATCCLGCKNGDSCTKKGPKKAKSSSPQVKDATKKRKYVYRKKPGRRKKQSIQTTKPNRQSGTGLTVIYLYGDHFHLHEHMFSVVTIVFYFQNVSNVRQGHTVPESWSAIFRHPFPPIVFLFWGLTVY